MTFLSLITPYSFSTQTKLRFHRAALGHKTSTLIFLAHTVHYTVGWRHLHVHHSCVPHYHALHWTNLLVSCFWQPALLFTRCFSAPLRRFTGSCLSFVHDLLISFADSSVTSPAQTVIWVIDSPWLSDNRGNQCDVSTACADWPVSQWGASQFFFFLWEIN